MIIVTGWLKEIAFFILNEKLYDNDVNAKLKNNLGHTWPNN
jgi:hypothetical protein